LYLIFQNRNCDIAIRFRMAVRQSRLVRKKRRFFYFNWLPWQRPLRNQKRGKDRSSTNKYLSFGAEIVKICPADPAIIFLRAIIKKERNYNASKIYSPVGNLAEQAKQVDTAMYRQSTFCIAAEHGSFKRITRGGSSTFTMGGKWGARDLRRGAVTRKFCRSYTGCTNKKQSPRKKLYFSHGSMYLSQTFRLLCEYSHKISCKFY